MVAMSLLLFVFRARDHRGLYGDLRSEDDRRRTRRAGAQRRTLSQRVSWPARGMGEAQGKKVAATALRLRRSRRSRSSARSSHPRGPVRPVLNATSGEELANLCSAVQEVATVGRRERNRVREMAVSLPGETFARYVLPRPDGAALTVCRSNCCGETTLLFRLDPAHSCADLRQPVR